jgi:hypothetical protein
MFAEPYGMYANLVRQGRLFDDVANDLRLWQQLAVGAGGDVAERVHSELDFLRHRLCFSCIG